MTIRKIRLNLVSWDRCSKYNFIDNYKIIKSKKTNEKIEKEYVGKDVMLDGILWRCTRVEYFAQNMKKVKPEDFDDYMVEAYYGYVQIQKNVATKAINDLGYYVRNASSAYQYRYTITFIDEEGSIVTSDRITKARINAIIDIITGGVQVPADVLDNLMHNGYNGLRAYWQAKKGQIDQNLLYKIQKTALSHQEIEEKGEEAHWARVAIR